MREIEFRIYDTLNKEYEDPSDIQISCDDGLVYEAVAVPLNSKLSAGIVLKYGVIAEQYIGLKDNSTPPKKIFEGDRIKDTHYHRLLEVIFENGMYCVKYDDGTLGFPHPQFTEVIGNIHEDVSDE